MIRTSCIRRAYILPIFDDYGFKNGVFDRISISASVCLRDGTETIWKFKSALPLYSNVEQVLRYKFLELRTSFYLVLAYIGGETPFDWSGIFNNMFATMSENCEKDCVIPYDFQKPSIFWNTFAKWIDHISDNAPSKDFPYDGKDHFIGGCEYPSLMISSHSKHYITFDDNGHSHLTTDERVENPLYSIRDDGRIYRNPLIPTGPYNKPSV